MKGFREFLMRGNLIDLAVAFILGASFSAVVSSFTQIIMDLIGLIGGNPSFDTVQLGSVNVGKFLTALVSFTIMSAVLYFGVVRPYQLLKDKLAKKPDRPATPTTDQLLIEIRDLLAKKS